MDMAISPPRRPDLETARMFPRILCRLAGAAFALASLLALGACGSLPKIDRGPIASEAIPLSTKTTLGRIAQGSQPTPDVSGFRLMPLGLFSLASRWQLARRADGS